MYSKLKAVAIEGKHIVANHLIQIHNLHPLTVALNGAAMAWYLNKYECSECGTAWEDEWSCMCDDECPNCGASDHSPVDSDDISAFTEKQNDGSFHIYYSPPNAEHHPDYELMATVKSKHLAIVLEQIALDLSKPA